MKSSVKKLVERVLRPFLTPIINQLDRQAEILRHLAKSEMQTRAFVKRTRGARINVVFVCHEPALWNMFESIYRVMLDDERFFPQIVALPYKHGSLPSGQFKDAGMIHFFESRGISAIEGYCKEKNEWLDPVSLMPDYIFFQTPYPLFPFEWSAKQISLVAHICYTPYATTVFRGETDDIVHPVHFFQFVSIVFQESTFCRDAYSKRFSLYKWFNQSKIVLSGTPKLDYLMSNLTPVGEVWRNEYNEQDRFRVLWTPRWHTGEGSCHFFDYKDFFLKFCSENGNVDFALRPHPLCFQNFIKTGEMTEEGLSQMKNNYARSSNMVIDEASSYQDTFISSDVLVSDISSMMLEYFATGKPVIYTHRIDLFNELGEELAKGVYQVNNETELKDTLKMLASGEDPLHGIRRKLAKEILYMPKSGAGVEIKEALLLDYN